MKDIENQKTLLNSHQGYVDLFIHYEPVFTHHDLGPYHKNIHQNSKN